MLYVTDVNLYFYSPFNDKTLFGRGTKIRIPLNQVVLVKKASNAMFMTKALKV
jgi:hypothetical protein